MSPTNPLLLRSVGLSYEFNFSEDRAAHSSDLLDNSIHFHNTKPKKKRKIFGYCETLM